MIKFGSGIWGSAFSILFKKANAAKKEGVAETEMDSRQELEKHTKVSIVWGKSFNVIFFWSKTSLKLWVLADNSI